jgi:hypothetical protein
MNDNLSDDLHDRICRLLDGEMDARETASLDDELRTNRDARALYLQLAALHSSLESHHASRTDASSATIIPIDRFLARQRRHMVRFASYSAAAVLLVSSVILWLNLAEKRETLAYFQTTPEAHYTLTHSGKENTPPGKTLTPGARLLLTSGTIELTFSSGVRSIINAPCDITCHSENLLSLAEGVAWFHVPPAASGFTVHSTNLEIIDIGTEFGVIATRDGADEVHVTKGSVEVALRKTEKPPEKIILNAGEARRIDSLGNLVQTALNAVRFPTTLLKPLAIRNADFEVVSAPSPDDDQVGYGPIQDWATSGEGAGLNNTSQPFLEQPAHSGSNVAFIQGNGLISQTVSGFDPSKPYSITYFVSERGLPGAATRTSTSLDLGSSFYIQPDLIRKTDAFRRIVSGPLHVFGPSANIEIRGQTILGDAALLIDSVHISRAVPAIPDGGFESAVLQPNQFVQAIHPDSNLLQPSAWKFSEGAGILHNGSPFAAPSAPEGSQAAVLQDSGAVIETTIHGFEPGVTYRLHLEAAGRNDGGGAAKLQFSLGEKSLLFANSEILHPPIGNFQTFTSPDFKTTEESLTLHIHSTSQGTTFLDDLRFEFVAEAENSN